MSRPSAAEMLDCAAAGKLNKPAPSRSAAPALNDRCKKNAKTKIARTVRMENSSAGFYENRGARLGRPTADQPTPTIWGPQYATRPTLKIEKRILVSHNFLRNLGENRCRMAASCCLPRWAAVPARSLVEFRR